MHGYSSGPNIPGRRNWHHKHRQPDFGWGLDDKVILLMHTPYFMPFGKDKLIAAQCSPSPPSCSVSKFELYDLSMINLPNSIKFMASLLSSKDFKGS